MKKISIVAPCYNESESLQKFVEAIEYLITEQPNFRFELVLVNDGSSDRTPSILAELCAKYRWLRAINLTRNFGKEAALTAGLDYATGDAIVFMDADLQHPPNVVKDFITQWESGYSVVVGVRTGRETDSKLYKFFAEAFYRLHNHMSDVKLPKNVGDFRLIDKKVADQLRLLRESGRFMKGLFAWVGHDYSSVEYTVSARMHGKSTFNKWKSWNFALEGITSFSTLPLRVWSYIGGLALLIGLFYSALIIGNSILNGVSTPGYVTLLTAIVVFGGIQLIGIGILGEYIGRIYMEVKRRPPYLIDRILGEDTGE